MRVPGLLLTPQQRARVALSALLLVSAGNAYLGVNAVEKVGTPKRGGTPDPYIEEFAELRRLVPPDARIGYLNLSLTDPAHRKRDLFLARYALAPRCVVADLFPPLLLVGGEASIDVGAGPVELLSDLGNGFRLYRHLTPP